MSVINPPEARELTAEEREERAEVCFEIDQRVKENISHGRQAMWELAKNLYEFNEANGWTALNYETQAEWLAQPEISMTKSDYHRLIRRYRELVKFRSLDINRLAALEPSKIDIVMPAIELQRVPVDDALNDVEALGARDLREKYMGPKQQHDPPPSGGATDPADDPDGDVIDGTAKTVETDDQPTNAADLNGDAPAAAPAVVSSEEAGKADEKLMHYVSAVDSWLDMGGDRRKAARNWRRLLETDSVLSTIPVISACIDGGDDAPDKTAAKEAWKTLLEALRIELVYDG